MGRPANFNSSRMTPTAAPTQRLKKSKIIAWIRAYRARTGEWPSSHSGPIPESPGDTWGTINKALMLGGRGLRGGSSLEEFLRGYQFSPLAPPSAITFQITLERVRAWARDHFEREGRWPHQNAGVIPNAGGLTWKMLDYMLRKGTHGLPGGTSLAILLGKNSGSARNVHSTPLTAAKILEWADAFHERTGGWPTARSGTIPESPDNTWQAVMTALHSGYRGFKGGVTLGQFLAKHRCAPLKRKRKHRLTIDQVLDWADAHRARTGQWPIRKSGVIPGTDGERWVDVSNALQQANRGLPKSSLAQLLATHRGVRNRSDLPPLTRSQILFWADAHFLRTGRWPGQNSGEIPHTQGETWLRVYTALREGSRGLRGEKGLTQLLQEERGVERVR